MKGIITTVAVVGLIAGGVYLWKKAHAEEEIPESTDEMKFVEE